MDIYETGKIITGFDYNTFDRNLSGLSQDEFEFAQELCNQYEDEHSDLPDDFEQPHDDYDEDDYYRELWQEQKEYEEENDWKQI